MEAGAGTGAGAGFAIGAAFPAFKNFNELEVGVVVAVVVGTGAFVGCSDGAMEDARPKALGAGADGIGWGGAACCCL